MHRLTPPLQPDQEGKNSMKGKYTNRMVLRLVREQQRGRERTFSSTSRDLFIIFASLHKQTLRHFPMANQSL